VKIKAAEILIGSDLTATSFRTTDGGLRQYDLPRSSAQELREQMMLMFDGAAPTKEMNDLVGAFNDLQEAIAKSKTQGA